MKFKKSLSIGLAAMMIFMVGCNSGNNESNTSTEDKDQIVYACTKDIRDINPHLYSGEMAAQNMVFESLIVENEDGIQPGLADSWEISEDGREYTFNLREDVVFTDGEEFNAEAVKLNFDAIIDNVERHSWLDLVNEIEATEVIDEYTFKLVLTHAYYPTLTELALTRPFRMLSPNCFVDGKTKDGITGYVGTGPWVLSEHKDNQYAIFTRNENYWGEKTKVSSVKWTVMPDTETMLLALENGEIDLIYGADGDQINADSYKALIESGDYETTLSNPIASRAIVVNSNSDNAPITSDLNVRLALQYAVNKEAIAEGILNGLEEIADTLMAKTVPYCDVDLEVRKLDVEKANSLLEESGWKLEKDGYRYKDGQMLELTISYNSDNAQEGTIGEYLQANFKEIGLKLNVLGEEKQSFLDRQKSGDFDLQYSLSWGTPYDPQSYVSSWRQPAHADYQAQTGLDRKQWLDETITSLMIETDEEKRESMYEEIWQYINEQAVYIPITYSRTKAVHSSDLGGVTFNPSQYEIPFEKMYFVK